MANFNELEIAMIIISLLVGSGGFIFFIKYGTRLKLLEKSFEERVLRGDPLIIEHNNLKTDVTILKNNMLIINTVTEKLNTLAVINEKLDTLSEIIKTVIPRAEMSITLANYEHRISILENEFKERLK